MSGRFLAWGLVCVLAVSGGATARGADGRDYWSHSRGHFEKGKDGNWSEVWLSARNNWVEKDRTEDYVELYDSKRKMTARLFADRCDVRMDGQRNFARRLTGKWRNAAVVRSPGKRELWEGASHSFRKGKDGKWTESHDGKTVAWVEKASTDEYVEVFDAERGYTRRREVDREP
jgi:hypothetical protein